MKIRENRDRIKFKFKLDKKEDIENSEAKVYRSIVLKGKISPTEKPK